MLDLKFIRENADEVKANITARNMTADVDGLLRLYEERNRLITEIDNLRRQRNENASAMKGRLEPEKRQKLIAEGKSLKEAIAQKESRSAEVQNALSEQALLIPNMAHPDAPRGKEEKDNLEVARWGEPVHFSFPAKNHTELAEQHQLIDFEAGAKVSGSKFYFLKNQAVMLDLALTHYALSILRRHGFTLTQTPDIAREEIAEGIGFNPRGEESNIYTLEGTGTCLVGTA
ncbi:MAG: serine--tRNA ligase, partial [Spirochaetales bacterium]